MPSAETSRLGGSWKPSEGMNWRSVLRKLRSPRNWIGPLSSVGGIEAETVSFWPAGASKAIWLMVMPMTLPSDRVKLLSSPWMVTCGAPPVSGITIDALRRRSFVRSPVKLSWMKPPSSL